MLEVSQVLETWWEYVRDTLLGCIRDILRYIQQTFGCNFITHKLEKGLKCHDYDK